jgi:hypothetical protein
MMHSLRSIFYRNTLTHALKGGRRNHHACRRIMVGKAILQVPRDTHNVRAMMGCWDHGYMDSPRTLHKPIHAIHRCNRTIAQI